MREKEFDDNATFEIKQTLTSVLIKLSSQMFHTPASHIWLFICFSFFMFVWFFLSTVRHHKMLIVPVLIGLR